MELTPIPEGGSPQAPIERSTSCTEEGVAPSAVTPSWDEQVIETGVAVAAGQGRPIDDRTARYIAGQLHGGQASGLYAFAATGAITDRAMSELVSERAVQEPAVQVWIDALIAYCAGRPDTGPVVGWVEQGEAEDRADLMARIATGSVRTLGDVAVVDTPESVDSVDDDSDTFPWIDAARWLPETVDGRQINLLNREELEALLSRDPDEEVGDVNELGWHGLVRNEDRPGGYIVSQRESGSHEVVECATGNALTEAWTKVTREYEQYYAEREAYENATLEAGDSHRSAGPQIWVASLADYNDGCLHGQWFDATCNVEELELATRFMLRGGRIPNAEEWAVMDYDGFGPLRLGEYASFETISRVASGIAEHGQAFAAWAAYVGPESSDALGRFEDHYCGEWESFEAYVENYLREVGFYAFLDHVPENMRGYVEVDVGQIARDWSGDYEVVERPEGGVWIFDPRV